MYNYTLKFHGIPLFIIYIKNEILITLNIIFIKLRNRLLSRHKNITHFLI